MRLRFWVGLAAVLAIAAGSVVAAAIVHFDDQADFDQMQRDEAIRSARQAEAVAALSLGQLSSAAAFFQAEETFTEHEFDVIAKPLLAQGALSGTAFLQRVPDSQRAAFERKRGAPIHELRDGGPRRALRRETYYPVAYAVSSRGTIAPIGYDLGGDPKRAPFLRRARDRGAAVATQPVPLLLGGTGINVYRPVYRDGAPIETVAQRRAALIGFAAGAFRIADLAMAALSSLADEADVQLQIEGKRVFGAPGELDDAATAPIHIADRTWLLIVRDSDRPDVSLPLLLAVVGIALAALLGTLILAWSRNERMQELQRQASLDSLTGLKNRRRFEVAMFGEDPRTSVESVISEADTAMYAAKDGGRDGVRVFDPVAIRSDASGSRTA